MDEAKILIGLVVACVTLGANVCAIVGSFYYQKFQLQKAVEGQDKLNRLMYDSDGEPRYRTTNDCKDCRKEICEYIKAQFEDMGKHVEIRHREHKEMVVRIHKRIDDAFGLTTE